MEYFAAQKLKESWGNKDCDHPTLEKVNYSGAFMINYTCAKCGADFTIAPKMEIYNVRKSKQKNDYSL